MFKSNFVKLFSQTAPKEQQLFLHCLKSRVLKTLYGQFSQRTLQSSLSKITEEKKKEENRPSSLIAQLNHSFENCQTEQNREGSRPSTQNLSERLEKLSKEMYSGNENKEDTSLPDSSTFNVRKLENLESSLPESSGENFIEDIVFKQDLHHRPKPSPLLGTEDQTIPPSDVPCVGCGALLQCQHRTVPGFMPSERYKLLSISELKSEICQRCHYIQYCDAFVEVTSNPEDYAKIISQIRPTRSLVVMVIDVMDIQGSIVPNLKEYIGKRHPLVVVGNKVDLIAPDCTEYLSKTKQMVLNYCHEAGLQNIRKVTLISAKTGFGIESLINTLFSFYKSKMDVFIVGTANAGKSSLFNTLLASDYCRQRVRDLIQRATVSVWPGTTLNLLKFPIMRPTSRTLDLRQKRLKQEKAIRKEDLKQDKQRKKEKEKKETWELKEEVKTTDMRTSGQIEKDNVGKPWGQEVFAYKGGKTGVISPSSFGSSEPFDASIFTHSYWMYDTPGVVNSQQIFNLLESDECRMIQPVTTITPRCVLMKPGTTVFISGLARMDYLQGSEAMMITVHCSPDLPIRVVSLEEADDYYLQHIGTPQLGIPVGGRERLERLPSLVAREFEANGGEGNLAVADIQLSSIGWISLAPRHGCTAKIRAYTPGRRGISLRSPPLVARFMPFKGKRISGTPFFHTRQVGLAMMNETSADREER